MQASFVSPTHSSHKSAFRTKRRCRYIDFAIKSEIVGFDDKILFAILAYSIFRFSYHIILPARPKRERRRDRCGSRDSYYI